MFNSDIIDVTVVARTVCVVLHNVDHNIIVEQIRRLCSNIRRRSL